MVSSLANYTVIGGFHAVLAALEDGEDLTVSGLAVPHDAQVLAAARLH